MKRFGMFLILLVCASLACSSVQVNLFDTPAPGLATPAIPGAPPPAQPPVQLPVIQLPNLSGVQLGDEFRDEHCGISFRKIPSWGFDATTGFGPEMTAPGADIHTGPIIMVLCGVFDYARTNDDLITKITANTDASGTPEANPIIYSNQRNIRVGGVNAVSLDTRAQDTASGGIVAVKGRYVVAMITPYRSLGIVGLAPDDKWEETRPYFEAVVNSFSFFEPTVTPTANP